MSGFSGKGFGRKQGRVALVAAGVVGLGCAGPALADGTTTTGTGSAGGQVVTPIVLTHKGGTKLSFGQFTAGTGGTVSVTATGSGSTTAGVNFVPGSSNAADGFKVTGDPRRAFAITSGTGTVTYLTHAMNFTTTPSATSATLNGGGNDSFTVGGTLTVPSGATVGQYTGSYMVTVSYD